MDIPRFALPTRKYSLSDCYSWRGTETLKEVSELFGIEILDRAGRAEYNYECSTIPESASEKTESIIFAVRKEIAFLYATRPSLQHLAVVKAFNLCKNILHIRITLQETIDTAPLLSTINEVQNLILYFFKDKRKLLFIINLKERALNFLLLAPQPSLQKFPLAPQKFHEQVFNKQMEKSLAYAETYLQLVKGLSNEVSNLKSIYRVTEQEELFWTLFDDEERLSIACAINFSIVTFQQIENELSNITATYEHFTIQIGENLTAIVSSIFNGSLASTKYLMGREKESLIYYCVLNVKDRKFLKDVDNIFNKILYPLNIDDATGLVSKIAVDNVEELKDYFHNISTQTDKLITAIRRFRKIQRPMREQLTLVDRAFAPLRKMIIHSCSTNLDITTPCLWLGTETIEILAERLSPVSTPLLKLNMQPELELYNLQNLNMITQSLRMTRCMLPNSQEGDEPFKYLEKAMHLYENIIHIRVLMPSNDINSVLLNVENEIRDWPMDYFGLCKFNSQFRGALKSIEKTKNKFMPSVVREDSISYKEQKKSLKVIIKKWILYLAHLKDVIQNTVGISTALNNWMETCQILQLQERIFHKSETKFLNTATRKSQSLLKQIHLAATSIIETLTKRCHEIQKMTLNSSFSDCELTTEGILHGSCLDIRLHITPNQFPLQVVDPLKNHSAVIINDTSECFSCLKQHLNLLSEIEPCISACQLTLLDIPIIHGFLSTPPIHSHQ